MTNSEEVEEGDIIVCIDNSDVKFGALTLDKEYIVRDISLRYPRNDNEEWIRLYSDRGDYWYHGYRFEQKKYLKPMQGWLTP